MTIQLTTIGIIIIVALASNIMVDANTPTAQEKTNCELKLATDNIYFDFTNTDSMLGNPVTDKAMQAALRIRQKPTRIYLCNSEVSKSKYNYQIKSSLIIKN